MDDQQSNIEKYIEGKMTAEELQAFEQQLTIDTALANAYEAEIVARQLITEAGRLDLKETLEVFDAEMEHSPGQGGVIPLWMKRVLPVAAMFVIFIGVYQIILIDSTTSSEVYDTYFETYAAPSVLRDVGIDESINWEMATNLYAAKNYRDAVLYFAKAEGEVPVYLSEFYKGMSNMNLDAPYYQRAINAFDIVLQTDNDYRQQAQWYKALALLGINNKEEAIAIFNSIVENRSYNYMKAEEILKLKWER